MPRRLLAAYIVPLGLCAAVGLRAQAAPQQPGPAQVVERFLADLYAGRWAEAASWLDPDALYRIRLNYLNNPYTWETPRPRTVEDYLRKQPEMPRAVAEWFVKQDERARAGGAIQPPHIYEFGLDSILQLQRLKQPDELGLLWVKAHDEAYRLREDLQKAGCAFPRELDSVLRARNAVVYGALQRDSTTAFVMFEPGSWVPISMEDFALPAIAKVRRVGSDWRIVPREGLLAGNGAFFGFNGCPQRQPSRAVAAITAQLGRYEHFVLVMAHDSIAALFTPDGELHTTGQPSPVGPAAIAAYLKSFSQFRVMADSMTADSTTARADSGRQVGTYWQRVVVAKGDTVEVRGRFEARWRRSASGQWQLSWLGTSPER